MKETTIVELLLYFTTPLLPSNPLENFLLMSAENSLQFYFSFLTLNTCIYRILGIECNLGRKAFSPSRWPFTRMSFGVHTLVIIMCMRHGNCLTCAITGFLVYMLNLCSFWTILTLLALFLHF